MTRVRFRPQRRVERDEGTTLIELLVSVSLFAVVLGVLTGATMAMFHDLRKQQGQADNLNANRKALLLLDKQVRYANAINTPGLGSDGNTYVEWRTGYIGQQQSCTQWRYNATVQQLQVRTWDEPFPANPSTAVTPSAWSTQTTGVIPMAGSPLFSITPTLLDSQTGQPVAKKQQLTIVFGTVHGHPATTTKSQLTLTAANTTSPAAPTTPVCYTDLGAGRS